MSRTVAGILITATIALAVVVLVQSTVGLDRLNLRKLSPSA